MFEQLFKSRLNRDVTLHKAMWDRVALKRLHDAADPATTADAVAIMMDEGWFQKKNTKSLTFKPSRLPLSGLAYLFLLKPNMTITAARIEVSIPRKRRGVEKNKKFENTNNPYE